MVGERQYGLPLDGGGIAENRRIRVCQRKTPIRAIIGNPPWSVQGDGSAGLDAIKGRVKETYVRRSSRRQLAALYDKYVLALRWATDRLILGGGEGVIAFVTNAGWITGDSAQGVRRCMMDEFSEIEIFNLRGNANTSGEVWRNEGAKVFGQASKAPVCLFVGMMNPAHDGPAVVKYHAVGDGLSLNQKMAAVESAGGGRLLEWTALSLDEHGDWLNKRSRAWSTMIPLGRKDAAEGVSVFGVYSRGLATSDDGRMYADRRSEHVEFMPRRIEEYNRFAVSRTAGTEVDDGALVKWHRELRAEARRGRVMKFTPDRSVPVFYRPFVDRYVYFERGWCAQRYRLSEMVAPTSGRGSPATRIIAVGGMGEKCRPSVLMVDRIADLGLFGKVQLFPEYTFREGRPLLNVNQSAVNALCKKYGADTSAISASDLFDFVYGRLNDPGYQESFEYEAQKDIPRVAWPATFDEFLVWRDLGRALSGLHLGWRTAQPYPLDEEYAAGDLLTDVDAAHLPDRPRWLDRDTKRKRLRISDNLVLAGFPENVHGWCLGYDSALNGLIGALRKLPEGGRGQIEETGVPRYWTQTIGRVVRLAVETQQLVGRG